MPEEIDVERIRFEVVFLRLMLLHVIVQEHFLHRYVTAIQQEPYTILCPEVKILRNTEIF